MGSTVSVPQAEPQASTITARNQQQDPSQWEEAIAKGNYLVVEQGFRQKVGDVASVMDAYRKDDYQSLLSSIETISKNMQGSDKKLEISEPIKKALAQHHKAILYHIDETVQQDYESRADNAAKNSYMDSQLKDPAKYEKIIKRIEEEAKTPKFFFDAINKFYNKDLQSKITKIIDDPFLEKNDIMKQNISTVAENIKSLKVRYKFFEYKYMQLNIFMILLVQHVFVTMDDFVSQVMTFSQQRDIMRDEMLKKTFGMINEIMTAADIGIDANQFTQMNGLLEQLSNEAKEKEKLMNEKVKALSEIAHTSLQHFIGNLSEASQNDARIYLNSQTKGFTPSMRGGFPKGSSHFPPSFFEASGSHAGTFPRGDSI